MDTTFTVGKVGSPHGLHGEVFVYLRTDSPDQRFRIGQELTAHPKGKTSANEQRTLTVSSTRPSHRHTKSTSQQGIFVFFDEITTREDAQKLKDYLLVIDMSDDESEDDAFYPQQLINLDVIDTHSNQLGKVTEVVFGSAQDLLVVTPILDKDNDAKTDNILVPFVQEIVTTVDLESAQLVMDPPEGLFPTNQQSHTQEAE